jgi:hypothetical protein
MRLKIFITTCVCTAALLLLSIPFVMRNAPPEEASQSDKAKHGILMLSIFGGAAMITVAAAGGAVLLIRKVRREYFEKQADNLQGLVEGTLRDHAKKKQD